MNILKLTAKTCSALLTVFFLFASAASAKEFKWGGPGYDPSLKKSRGSFDRYTAQFKYDYNQGRLDETIVEILVDSEEAVNEVGRMDLIATDGKMVSSTTCFKAMKHLTAPWACSFRASDLENLNGRGRVSTLNKSQQVILEDRVDFDALKNTIKQKND